MTAGMSSPEGPQGPQGAPSLATGRHAKPRAESGPSQETGPLPQTGPPPETGPLSQPGSFAQAGPPPGAGPPPQEPGPPTRPGRPDPGLETVDGYLADVLASIRPLQPIVLGLSEAENGVLAEDITARSPLPSFDNSAMDGYAVCADDLITASERTPVTLPVVGEVTAGDIAAYAVSPGMCLRITTGAQLPSGADAIVPVEWTDDGTARVTISESVARGHAIRRRGDDALEGDVLLTEGTRLGPVQIGLLAAAGRNSALVHTRPRVVVISTGNELTEPGTPVVPGKIWESNSFMLAAAARQAGCLAYRHGVVPDDPREVLPAIEDQLVRADVIVTSGGISMGGEHDVIKEVLSRYGTVRFCKVAMQPGMPQGFGTIGEDRTPIFTLPGNPVSAYVSFQLFVRPALGVLQGVDMRQLPVERATLTGPLRSPPGRRSFLRGVLDTAEGTVAPLSGQGSHQLATLGKANALIVVPEWVVQLRDGETADVMSLP